MNYVTIYRNYIIALGVNGDTFTTLIFSMNRKYFGKVKMRITLEEPELELVVNKVDTPTGTGWCVIMPDDRKILIKFMHGKWQTTDAISNHFVQSVGNEISRVLETDKLSDHYLVSTPRPKRTRILKYFLV